MLGKSQTTIHKGIHFLELREIHLLATTRLIVVCVTVEGTTIYVDSM